MPKIISKQVNIFQTQRRRSGTTPSPCVNWILYDGTWNDTKAWVDTCTWND